MSGGRDNRLLINQNVDTVDLLGKDDDVERKALNIYTLTEQRFESWRLEAGNFWETVDFLHARSVRIFAASITEAQREALGIDGNGVVNE